MNLQEIKKVQKFYEVNQKIGEIQGKLQELYDLKRRLEISIDRRNFAEVIRNESI